MKTIKYVITAIICLWTCGISAQNSINYKALVKDANGNVLVSAPINIQFTIYEGDALTNNVYRESHALNTDANGIIIAKIGQGTTSDIFSNINWSDDEHFLNVQIDIGSGLVDLGTSEFNTVPYALIAQNSANKIDDLLDGKSDNDGSNDGSSIFLGTSAGVNDDGTNNRNIGIGWETLTLNTSGRDNMAIGNNALASNTNGIANVGIGTETLFNTIGSYNIGIGYHALFSNTSGNDNVAIGYEALNGNTTGVNNNAIGTHALRENTTGFFNNAFGRHALQTNTTGAGNTAVGHGSLRDNLTGSNNASFGNGAGDNVNGNDNVFIGYNAGLGLANSTNSGNIVIGYNAGSGADYNNRLYIDNTNTSNPLLYGEFDNNLLRVNGVLDISNAYQFPTIDGAENQVLQTNGSGILSWQNLNNSSGLEALNEGNGIGWRLVGRDPSLFGNIGLNAVDLSFQSIVSTLNGATGDYAFATGEKTRAFAESSTAMGTNTTASGNASTAIGSLSTASGFASLSAGALNNATGDVATAFGFNTDANSLVSFVIGRYNIGGGSSAQLWVETDPLFEVGIGSGSLSRENALTILKNGNVGIGTHNPQSELHVDGELRIGTGEILSDGGSSILQVNSNFAPEIDNNRFLGTASKRWNTVYASNGIINTSDRRDKTNISPISYGIKDIMKLNPVSFNWKSDAMNEKKLGLIAQDLKEVIPEVVKIYENTIIDEKNPTKTMRKEIERMGVFYSDLIPVLVKSIQEQQEIIENQNKKIERIEKILNALLEQKK